MAYSMRGINFEENWKRKEKDMVDDKQHGCERENLNAAESKQARRKSVDEKFPV